MARERTVFRCGECGGVAPRWVGRCPACGEWNTLVEERDAAPTAAASRGRGLPTPPAAVAMPITELLAESADAVPTGVSELDRVLGGGLVAGSVTLLGG